MIQTLIALALLAVIATAWRLWRHTTRRLPDQVPTPSLSGGDLDARPEFPPSGLLVSESVLQSAGSGSAAVWDALDVAAVPVAVEYFPVSEPEIAKYRTVPVNAAAQKSMVDIVNALNPSSPTLYRVVLPKGAELVRAVGTSGFRGFSRAGGKTAHAVLKPVAAGGALAVGWPVFAVAGTVMAVDMMAQRELRAHQRRVESILGRQEERAYRDRMRDQRSADAQLTRAIGLILDGRNPPLELALKSSYDVFHDAQLFLNQFRGVLEMLVEPDGKIDYRRLEAMLGKPIEDEHFFRELHMARGAIAIQRKALLADAASAALTDQANPYTALRKFFDSQARQLEQAEADANYLTTQLTQVELKGGWSIPKAVEKQARLRALAAPPTVDGEVELQFLRTASGDIVQVTSINEKNEDTEEISSSERTDAD